MPAILPALTLALAQLFDPRILRILLKSLAVTAVIFVLVAGAGWYAIDAMLQWAGLADSWFSGAGELRGLAALLLALVGLWLVWRITAMAVIQFYAEDVVKAVEDRYYPHAAKTARDLPLSQQLRHSLVAAGRALLFNLLALPFALILLVTAIGPALLFWAVNAVLLGRELQDMVWLRHGPALAEQAKGENSPQAAPVSRAERFLLGGVVAALMAVPFIQFLAPVLGAAAATHLIHRKDSTRHAD